MMDKVQHIIQMFSSIFKFPNLEDIQNQEKNEFAKQLKSRNLKSRLPNTSLNFQEEGVMLYKIREWKED